MSKDHVRLIIDVINKGVWAYRKDRAMHMTKKVLVAIWTVTIFPLVLIYMFITDNE